MGNLKEAAERIRKRLNDPRLMFIPGLKDDLAGIAAGMQEADHRLESLERWRNEQTAKNANR